MAAFLRSTPVNGLTRVQWVLAIADITAPKLTEINAVSSVDISCYLTADGWNPGLSEAKVSDPRLCSTSTYEGIGKGTDSLDIRYIENPGTANIAINKAAVALTSYAYGFFVQRRGIAYAQAFAVGDLVDVWPVQLGRQDPMAPAENTVYTIKQGTGVISDVTRSVAVVA